VDPVRPPNISVIVAKKSPRPMPLDNTKVNMHRIANPANTTLLYRRNEWNGLKAITVPHVTASRHPPAAATGLDAMRNRIVWVDWRLRPNLAIVANPQSATTAP